MATSMVGIAVTISALVLAGCAFAPDDTVDSQLFATYQQFLDEGLSNGMSDEQALVLENAIANQRPVTFEEYKQAVAREISCIEDLGFRVENRREIQHAGWTEIAFGYGGFATEAEGDALLDDVDSCMNVNADWVQLAYSDVTTVEQADAQFSEYRAAVVACMAKRGIPVAADATRKAILDADLAALAEGQESCAAESGYSAAS